MGPWEELEYNRGHRCGGGESVSDGLSFVRLARE